jgi:hypothetical protein
MAPLSSQCRSSIVRRNIGDAFADPPKHLDRLSPHVAACYCVFAVWQTHPALRGACARAEKQLETADPLIAAELSFRLHEDRMRRWDGSFREETERLLASCSGLTDDREQLHVAKRLYDTAHIEGVKRLRAAALKQGTLEDALEAWRLVHDRARAADHSPPNDSHMVASILLVLGRRTEAQILLSELHDDDPLRFLLAEPIDRKALEDSANEAIRLGPTWTHKFIMWTGFAVRERLRRARGDTKGADEDLSHFRPITAADTFWDANNTYGGWLDREAARARLGGDSK